MFLFIRVLIKIISGIIFIIILKNTLFSEISEKVSKNTPFSEISERVSKTPLFEIPGPGFTLTFKPFLRENGDKHEV